MKISRSIPAEQRLMQRVTITDDGCWNWTGYLAPSGYGKMMVEGRHMRAHRASYQLLIGKIPDRCELHHLCQNKACVNPDHLVPLYPIQHKITDGRARREFCKHGHRMSPDNIYTPPRSNSYHCKKCRVSRTRAWEGRNKEDRLRYERERSKRRRENRSDLQKIRQSEYERKYRARKNALKTP